MVMRLPSRAVETGGLAGLKPVAALSEGACQPGEFALAEVQPRLERFLFILVRSRRN